MVAGRPGRPAVRPPEPATAASGREHHRRDHGSADHGRRATGRDHADRRDECRYCNIQDRAIRISHQIRKVTRPQFRLDRAAGAANNVLTPSSGGPGAPPGSAGQAGLVLLSGAFVAGKAQGARPLSGGIMKLISRAELMYLASKTHFQPSLANGPGATAPCNFKFTCAPVRAVTRGACRG
jgi:hypothetical protein